MPSRLKNLLTSLAPQKQTQFSPELENVYQGWIRQNNIPESNDYDMRGFFMGMLANDPAATSGINPSDGELHFSDKWKLPNHSKFSNESKYSNGTADPRWVENPAPYKTGTWGRQGLKGLLDVEIPE